MEQVNQRLDEMEERIDAIVRTLSSASIELSNLKQDIKVMKANEIERSIDNSLIESKEVEQSIANSDDMAFTSTIADNTLNQAISVEEQLDAQSQVFTSNPSISQPEVNNDDQNTVEYKAVDSTQNEEEVFDNAVNMHESISPIIQQGTIKIETVGQEQKVVEPVVSKNQQQTGKLERFIGKNTMAAGASVLIFIALAMFATVIVPVLTDEIKMVAMFLFSFGLIGVGEKFTGKNKGFIALTACGVGSLLISAIISYSYFEFYNFIVLYILLLLWDIFVSYLGIKRSLIFSAIGQIGILVSMCLTIDFLGSDFNLTFMMILFLLTELPFIIANFVKKQYYGYFIMWCGGVVITSIITLYALIVYKFSNLEYYPMGIDWIGFILAIFFVVFTGVVADRFVKTDNEKAFSFVQLLITTFVVNHVLLAQIICRHEGFHLMKEMWILSIAIDVFAIALFEKYLLSYSDKTMGIIFQVFCVVSILGTILINSTIEGFILVPLIAAGLLYYGRKLQHVHFRILAGVLALYPVVNFDRDSWLRIICELVCYGLLLADVIFENKKAKAVKYNNVAYAIGYLVLIDFINVIDSNVWLNYDIKNIIILGISLVIQLVVLNKKWTSIDEEDNVVFWIINSLLMVGAIAALGVADGAVETTLLSLILLGLFGVNTTNLVRINPGFGLYIVIKYTVAAIIILGVCSAPGFVFSITYLLIAITSIVIGFKKENKPIRIYGLVLSMFSIVKLILWDISYNSLPIRALGFLVCGMLCFAISFIYHKLDVSDKA
ncbi:Predicted membrane protein [Pseudobutyrivibrio sp. NOR37]|nr:Predicted membrane protein [Pseudobutyrivibrio sp. NOR37]